QTAPSDYATSFSAPSTTRSSSSSLLFSSSSSSSATISSLAPSTTSLPTLPPVASPNLAPVLGQQYKTLFDEDAAEGRTGLSKARFEIYQKAEEIGWFSESDSETEAKEKSAHLRRIVKRATRNQRVLEEWKGTASIVAGVTGALFKLILRTMLPPEHQKGDAWLGDALGFANSGLASLIPGLVGEGLGRLTAFNMRVFGKEETVFTRARPKVFQTQSDKEKELLSMEMSLFFSALGLEVLSKVLPTLIALFVIEPMSSSINLLVTPTVVPEAIATVNELYGQERADLMAAMNKLINLVSANSRGWPTEALEELFVLQES
ncbi:hypothetical protein P7C70_g9352, partial [Phenoliferia sp. Uapishka_3]